MTGTEAKANAPAIVGHFSHSFVELDDPERWTFFVSHHDHPVRRLVVFVHGFRGESVGTWLDFPLIDADLGCVHQGGVRVGPDERYRRVVAE